MEPRIQLTDRPLIAHGEQCLWWGALAEARIVASPAGDGFRCPFCGGLAIVLHTEESLLRAARRFEQLGFPGHEALVRWLKGRCYRTRAEAWSAFVADGGRLS